MTDTICTLRSGGSRSFFFIFDGEGEVMLYLNLAKRLPKDFTVYGIMPQTKPKVPLASVKVEDMASDCIQQIKNHQTKGPYYVGGLCAGGLIAFEVAVQLEKNNENIDALVLLEAVEPSATLRKDYETKKRIKRFKQVFTYKHLPQASSEEINHKTNVMINAMKKIIGASSYEVSSRVKSLTTSLRIKILTNVLNNNKSWPNWIKPLEVSEVYASARDKYKASSLSSNKVILVKSSNNILGGYTDEPLGELFHEELLGWKSKVKSDITLINVKGGHSSMLQEPHVEDLAHQLTPLLKE